jgi:hypothetical protein
MREHFDNLGAADAKHPVSREEMIRSMLAIWLYDDRPELFEALWWRSDDRVIRSLAARLATGRPGEAVRRVDCSQLLDHARFSAWERQQRSEEVGGMLQHRLTMSVAEWRKRSEARPEGEN